MIITSTYFHLYAFQKFSKAVGLSRPTAVQYSQTHITIKPWFE